MSTSGGYHENMGGYHENMGDVQYIRGYHDVCETKIQWNDDVIRIRW